MWLILEVRWLKFKRILHLGDPFHIGDGPSLAGVRIFLENTYRGRLVPRLIDRPISIRAAAVVPLYFPAYRSGRWDERIQAVSQLRGKINTHFCATLIMLFSHAQWLSL